MNMEGTHMPTCMCILHQQTEGTSNKYRMPQKRTLPSGGSWARPGSTHQNTIFIMLWPHKSHFIRARWLGRIRCQGELSKQGWLALMSHSYFYFNFITFEHPISSAVLPFYSFFHKCVPFNADPPIELLGDYRKLFLCCSDCSSACAVMMSCSFLFLMWGRTQKQFMCQNNCKPPSYYFKHIRQLTGCAHLQIKSSF